MGWRRGQAYGQDLRDRVMAASGSLRGVATRFSVSESYVARVRSRQRRGPSAAMFPSGSMTRSRPGRTGGCGT